MNLTIVPFSRRRSAAAEERPTASAPAWRALQEENTQTVRSGQGLCHPPGAELTDLCHPGAALANSQACTNDAPLEPFFRATQQQPSCSSSYRKRSSDCLFGTGDSDDNDDDEDLGRFLSSYLSSCGDCCTDDLLLKGLDDASEAVITKDEPPPADASAVLIDPIPLGRTAELQLQIEAQAREVRQSLCSSTGKNKKRRTFRSEPVKVKPNDADEPVKFVVATSNECLESFSAAAAANARQTFQGRSSRRSYNDWRTNNSSYDSDRSSFASCPDEELSLSTSSNAWGKMMGCSVLSSSSHSGGGGMQQSSNKRGSITDLIGPMSAVLSSMQQSTSRSMTLNANASDPRQVITVSKNDVVCGSGALTDALIGNRRYKVLVDLHSRSYAKANGEDERKCVASSVVNTIRSSIPAGRFLRLDLTLGLWREVQDMEHNDGSAEGAVAHVERALKEDGGVSSLEPTPLAIGGARLQRHCSSASAAVRAVAA